jgi:predicted dehydrogenase
MPFTDRQSVSRRALLGATSTAASARSGLGADDRISVALIGVGYLGLRHLRERLLPLASDGRMQMVAACDVYEKAKQRARDLIGLQSKDIHHVVIVTPEHLHYPMAMAALHAGKDIYLEKPMTRSIEEARELAATARKSGRVLQVGSQHVAAWSSSSLYGLWEYRIEPEATAQTVDWPRFLGSAPKRPFSADRYFRWRKYWDYSGGIATDLFYHNLSPLLFAAGPQFPVRVSAHGGILFSRDREVPDVYSMTAEYENFAIELSANSASSALTPNRPTVIFGREASSAVRRKTPMSGWPTW